MWGLEVPPMTRVPPVMVAPMTSAVAASHFLLLYSIFFRYTLKQHSAVFDNISGGRIP